MTEADIVLRDIENNAQGDFFFIIGPEKGKYLADAVIRFKVKKVLEVGTLYGYSAILMARNLPSSGQGIFH